MLKNRVVLLPQIWNYQGIFWKCDHALVQITHHGPKTLRVYIQEHPAVLVPWKALVPPSAEESLHTVPLDKVQGVSGYRHHEPPPPPPRIDFQNI